MSSLFVGGVVASLLALCARRRARRIRPSLTYPLSYFQASAEHDILRQSDSREPVLEILLPPECDILVVGVRVWRARIRCLAAITWCRSRYYWGKCCILGNEVA